MSKNKKMQSYQTNAPNINGGAFEVHAKKNNIPSPPLSGIEREEKARQIKS